MVMPAVPLLNSESPAGRDYSRSDQTRAEGNQDGPLGPLQVDPVRILVWGSFSVGIVVSWIAIGWGLLKVLT